MDFNQLWILKKIIDLVKKKEKTDVICQNFQTIIQRRDFSTGQMKTHLLRHHNFMKKYDANKQFENIISLFTSESRDNPL